jgi:hypothetical protein
VPKHQLRKLLVGFQPLPAQRLLPVPEERPGPTFVSIAPESVKRLALRMTKSCQILRPAATRTTCTTTTTWTQTTPSNYPHKHAKSPFFFRLTDPALCLDCPVKDPVLLHLARSTLPVVFALAAVSSAAGSVTFEMRPVAVLPFRPSVTIPCGDADRDRKPELYLEQGLDQIYAFEHLGGYRFDTIPLPLPHLLLWAIGDADRDGHMELVTQGGFCIVVYESPDSFSLPDSLVWADTIVVSTYMHAVIVDLNADSAREIACLVYNEFSVYVLENTGDNRFEFTTRVHEPNRPPTRFCQTFDMDLDGRPEFALGSDNGWVCFYEAVCNDSLRPYRRLSAGGLLAPAARSQGCS